MNAAETIAAAIQVLEDLKGLREQPDDWRVEEAGLTRDGEPATTIFDPEDRPLAFEVDAFDSALIVTLHRTIDAQLAILRDGLEVATNIAEMGFGSTLGRNQLAFDLARAILGEAS